MADFPELIAAWRDWAGAGAQGLLKGDEALCEDPGRCGWIRSWEDYRASGRWASKDDQFQLGLLPVPYVGNLSEAKVWILLLNPGCGPLDFFGEDRVPEYRQAILDNLLQNDAARRRGFFYLDPEFSWSGGFRYWHGKLRGVVEEFRERTGLGDVGAWDQVRGSIATLELVPYHSSKFRLPSRTLAQLESVRLVRSYLSDHLLPRARNGAATLVVTRKSRMWHVSGEENVIVYGAGQARGAHLGPTTAGGRAILARLLQG